MAVGLSFALAAQSDGGSLSAAMALAVGIGLQNFPEGAAISLPLRQEGISTGRAFLYGALSGVVEPIFGISVVLAAGTITPFMPWLLSFAAGTMMYVVTEELIPEAAFGRALQYRHDERDVWLCRNDDLRHRTGIEKLIILICQRPSIYFRQMGGRLCFLG